MKKKERYAFYAHILLAVLEAGAIIASFHENPLRMLRYYTEDSNILSLISSLFYIFYYCRGEIPRYVRSMRLISVCMLSLTLIVVLLMLGPMYGYRFVFYGSQLYLHLICPLLSIAILLFLERNTLEEKDAVCALYPTLLYGMIVIPLNILKIMDGPYPFLRVYHQPVYMSVLWIVILIGGSYLYAKLMVKLNRS